MNANQTAKIVEWVRAKTPVGHRQVCIQHLNEECPARVPVANTSTEDYLSPCICSALVLRLGPYVYSFDVNAEVFARIGEQQGRVLWMHPIPPAIRR